MYFPWPPLEARLLIRLFFLIDTCWEACIYMLLLTGLSSKKFTHHRTLISTILIVYYD